MLLGYVRFSDRPEGTPTSPPVQSTDAIFSRWDNGIIRAVTPAEWLARDTATPVLWEATAYMDRYVGYDNALRK
jgi:hypothetical protein